MIHGVTIGEAYPEDRNLIVDSWRRSLQDAPAYAGVPTRAYVHWVTEIIEHFLGPSTDKAISLAGSDVLLVARDFERPMYVYGWALARDTGPGMSVVYLYVKAAHRREGLARELFASALERCSAGPVTYAFRTRFDRWFEDLGVSFRPVEALCFGKVVA